MVEVILPTDFFIVFLGLAALLVGPLVSLGILPSLWMQAVAFALLSIGALTFLRGPLVKGWATPAAGEKRVGDLRDESVVLMQDLEPGGEAKAELRGSSWSVRTDHGEKLTAGQHCRVKRVDGLVLWVSPETASVVSGEGER